MENKGQKRIRHFSGPLKLGMAVLLSLVGVVGHNALEFGWRGLLAADTGTVPVVLVQAAVFFAWWKLPSFRSWALGLLGVLALLHVAGGAVISVLPLAALPFEPEQSVSHYLSHVIYGLAQLPLLWLAAKGLLTGRVQERPRKAVE
ncbi:MAG: hypothetical protein R3191_03815 [Anaerolineales bacterium]|nr:hypothetical protein [Anaerolineales bacterium]